MRTASLILTISLAWTATAFAGDGGQDMRVELPRDLRLMLLGVPSTRDARAAETNLREAIRDYETKMADKDAAKSGSDRAAAKLFFRLGKFDQTLTALTNQLREQERIKGMEDYRTMARELAVRSESLGGFGGDSAAPVVDDGDDAAVPQKPAAAAGDLTGELKSQLALIDETLDRIDQMTKLDQERKAQLDRDMGTLGQFVLHLKGTVEQIRDVSVRGAGEVKVDADRFVQDLQGVIDVIRERKRERLLRERTEPAAPPRARSND